MSVKKSNNPIIAEINRHFVIRYEVVSEKGTKLIGAGKYKDLVGEELKIKHFKKVLEGGSQVYTFLIRNRLKIKFHSK
ncbi:hypothetical protein FLCU109888_11485 [Flavobacterium cucumis]|uniref:Uncharacterized protein n=1 Tax=Flavobacterium cucumis TaxID=416016 RepID=A0A1M7ZVP0_9FLAO|nr:hypothetical protein [Flavobacterium cucumis]SHO72873.1 hypothetical protein SAMN05443547_1217 [Flavobacterium cucumis]